MSRRVRFALTRIREAFGTTHVDQEFAAELDAHIEHHTAENIRRGLPPAEARRQAVIAVGGVEQLKETLRDGRGLPALENLMRDLRYAARALGHSPGFTVGAIAILVLGIGLNAAIFSIVNAVVLRPLPVPEPSRLMRVWHTPPPQLFVGRNIFALSPANYLDWRAQSDSFSKMAIYRNGRQTLTEVGAPQSLATTMGSASLLPLLGLTPIVGQGFTDADDVEGGTPTAILSEPIWRTRFGGDPSVIGRSILLNGQPRIVIGVVPVAPVLLDTTEAWLPLAWTAAEQVVRNNHNYRVLAQLKPGISVERAQADLSTIAKRLEAEYPADNKDWGALVLPLRDDLVGDTGTSLKVLLGAVLLVLIIACANLANLMFVRMHGRAKEIAIRTALGASRGRVVRQLLAEGVILGVVGGAAGMLAAIWSLDLLVSTFGASLPRAQEVAVDGRVLLFTVAVSLTTGIAAAFVPAWRLTGRNVSDTIKRSAARGSSSGSDRRVRNALVVSEVALALMLLIGAGLLMRSLSGLRAVDPGIDTRQMLTATVSIPGAKYRTDESRIAFFERTVAALRALPGVESAAAIDNLPLQGGSSQPVIAEGAPPTAESERPVVGVRFPTEGYFQTARIPLLAGRDFNDGDRPDRPLVAIVSELAAARLWPNQNPIGKHVTLSLIHDRPWEIVGVVREVKNTSLDEPTAETTIYLPAHQLAYSNLTLVLRTNGRPESQTRGLISAVQSIDPEQPVLNIQTMEAIVERSLGQNTSAMQLLSGFAGVAVLLAAVGIYSVLAYTVRQRVREIGIRMALGAPATTVLRMIALEGLKPTLAGVALGLALASVLTRVLSTLLFGVGAHDGVTFATVTFVLVAVGLAATVLPTYRATRISPAVALESE